MKSNLAENFGYEDDYISFGESILPFEIYAKSENINIESFVKSNRAMIDSLLYQYGAILFKNFNIHNAFRLREFAGAYTNELLEYTERGAPRVMLADKVYTSTEYSRKDVIPLHHEMSYSNNWPSKLFFCSEKVASEGGYTPLADDRKVIKDIPKSIKDRFIDKKIMYVRNYGLGIDMGWEEAFDTDDRAKVEAYLRETDTQYEWIEGNQLRTQSIRQVVATHPITKDTVWFNHAHLFHSSNLPADVRQYLTEEFTESGLPRNAYYGDGTPIEDSILDEIRAAYKKHTVKFDWQVGDCLLADNFLVTHGRTTFEGERRVCVAMAELYKNY